MLCGPYCFVPVNQMNYLSWMMSPQVSGISRHHISKVVHKLGELRYLTTVRGKNGGIRLAQDPAEIVIGDVVRPVNQALTF